MQQSICKYVLMSVLCLSCSILAAESHTIVEITPDKKIVHVAELGIADNMRVLEILHMLPELLDRGAASGSIMSNFSVQLDGKDVGQGRDVVLEQILAGEIDVIEISTSPTASEQKNGTGGVINIKLKPLQHDGLEGHVLLDATSELDVQPSLLLNYKKGKLEVRGNLLLEYYRPKRQQDSYTAMPLSEITQMDTSLGSYKQETAKLSLTYRPTDNDKLDVRVWESYGRQKGDLWSGITEMRHVEDTRPMPSGLPLIEQQLWREKTFSKAHELFVEANMEYQHLYRRGGEFKVQLNYNYDYAADTLSSSRCHADVPVVMVGGNTLLQEAHWRRPHEWAGEIKSKHPLLSPESAHSLTLEVGANATIGQGRKYNLSTSYLDGRVFLNALSHDTTTTYYVSPFMEWNYGYRNVKVRLGARYQYFAQQGISPAQRYFADNHTWTGNVNINWEVVKHHNLRLIGARNIFRETDNRQVAVRPCYNAELNYIYDWKDSVNTILTSVGLHYIYTELPVGKDRTLNANFQLLFQRGIFSMAFAGNIYSKGQYATNDVRYNWYYNLSLAPVFNFRKQWTLSGKVLYNSSVMAWNATYGDCFYTQIRVAKTIKHWTLHLVLSDILDYTSYDIVKDESGMVTKTLYDFYTRYVGIGFGYTF